MTKTKLTPAQRREDAELLCSNELHTATKCLHLPIALAMKGASTTQVNESFNSVATLMSNIIRDLQITLRQIKEDEEDASKVEARRNEPTISLSIDSLNVCWEVIACYEEKELEALSFNDYADALEAMSNRCAAGELLVVQCSNRLELKDYHALAYAERLFEQRYPKEAA